jgi:hypothetical protein
LIVSRTRRRSPVFQTAARSADGVVMASRWERVRLCLHHRRKRAKLPGFGHDGDHALGQIVQPQRSRQQKLRVERIVVADERAVDRLEKGKLQRAGDRGIIAVRVDPSTGQQLLFDRRTVAAGGLGGARVSVCRCRRSAAPRFRIETNPFPPPSKARSVRRRAQKFSPVPGGGQRSRPAHIPRYA